MRLRKVVIFCFMILVFASQSVFAFGFISESSQNIIKQTWSAQTLDQLKDGVVAVPESAVNDYLQSLISNYPEFKSIKFAIHSNNKIEADIDTETSGMVDLQGTITQFVQNKDNSLMIVHIDKKELVGRPVTSWFFSRMSIGMLTKLFGNPLKDNQYGVVAAVDGNNITVNFKPFIDHSPLKEVTVMGNSMADIINIDSVTTGEKVLYLHTSFNGSNMLYNVVKNIL
ncbi:hypothetical protein [Pectinatus sottacetonis]|uniref:hypothetical protein n=1 Tax=Pectinatus sottacetonis TaxID=1002795 RepID=UPI0018C5A7A7|nr:hypothetical protein [Pectinatus sottacetonis]